MSEGQTRFAIAVIAIGLVAAAFGSPAEGKRPSLLPRPAAVPIELNDTELRWCLSGSNVPTILEIIDSADLTGYNDEQWLWMVRVGAEDPQTTDDIRDLGRLFSGLRDRWAKWDAVCQAAYDIDRARTTS